MTGSDTRSSRPRLVLASGNRHKLEEVGRILRPLGIEVVAGSDLGRMPEVPEDGDTFEANALQKARAVWRRVHLPTLADDSGLEVDCLDGAPGTRSARYAGPGATDEANNRKLLGALRSDAGASDGCGGRTARFVCVLALVTCDGAADTFAGTCEGRIAEAPAGDRGFGYDPLFVPDGYAETFGELGSGVKDRISHRARALADLARALTERPGLLDAAS